MSIPPVFSNLLLALASATCALAAAPPTVAQETVLYDIDFSAPTHTLNARPATGAAPDKVSSIRTGSPTVVSSFGELTDRPLLFTAGSPTYDQIRLDGDPQIETCRLEFDLCIENLKDTQKSFTVFLDTPTVRRFSFDGTTNLIEGTSASWEEGRRLRCSVFADFKNNRWEARIDDALLFSMPVDATELRSIRFSMGSLGTPDPEAKAAVDNIRVVVTRRITPAVPQGFSATGGTGVNAIALSWSGVPEAESYRIYRSGLLNSASASLIAETTDVNYSDTNILLTLTYHYWIKSVTGTNTSPFSPVASARIDLGPPTSLTVSGPERTDGILLSWPAPPRATSYRIYRSESNSSTSATRLATTTSLTYLDTTALPGVRSYYWVDSGRDAVLSVNRVAGNGVRGLVPITGFEATSHLYANRIDLRWNPVPGATRYEIYRGETEDFTDAAFLGFASIPAYQDRSAVNDLDYHYWVTPLGSEAVGPTGPPVSGVASLFQPDLWLQGESVTEFGRGIVERRDASSYFTERRRNRSPFAVKLWVGKLGEREGRLTVEGSPGDRNFAVHYYRDGNVTAEVLLGRLDVHSEDGKGPVEILIQPSRTIQTLPGEKSYALVCRGISFTYPTTEDQVGMVAVSLPKRLPKPVRKPQVPVWTRPSHEDRLR